jgi:hypothetical protein
MIYVVLLGAAALLIAGPSLWRARPVILGPSEAATKPQHLAPTYQSAIADLAHVRLRLVQTKALDDKTKAAIDVLTLALVAGSDA